MLNLLWVLSCLGQIELPTTSELLWGLTERTPLAKMVIEGEAHILYWEPGIGLSFSDEITRGSDLVVDDAEEVVKFSSHFNEDETPTPRVTGEVTYWPDERVLWVSVHSPGMDYDATMSIAALKTSSRSTEYQASLSQVCCTITRRTCSCHGLPPKGHCEDDDCDKGNGCGQDKHCRWRAGKPTHICGIRCLAQ